MKTTRDAGLRGRLGYLLTPATLAYATGGVAWQHFEVTSTCANAGLCVALGPAVVANSATRAGWAVGGGLETALWGHWLARAEYRYADFGSAPFTIARAGLGGIVDNFDVKLRTHTATFGLAYKFGDPVTPGDLGSVFAAAMNPAPVTSWSGFYAGLSLGARASRTDLTTTSRVGGGISRSLSGLATREPFDGTGFRASPYVGLNWQFAPRWVAGVEGDFGFAGQTTTLAGFFSAPPVTISSAADSLAVKTMWDASLCGRFGFLLTPTTLVYATGGVAWQHYDVTATCASSVCAVLNGLTPSVVANPTTRAGWTLGGGLETALWEHWLARAEYRYADFGTAPFAISRAIAAGGAGLPTTDTFGVKLRTHTVSFGLAYKFN